MGMEKYMDIIEHEHHVSTRHPRMSAMERAAQFAPFAALTGFDAVIAQTDKQHDVDSEISDM